MQAVLGVDVGKTGCRAALWIDGDRGPVREVPGAPGLAAHGGVAAAEAAVLAAGRAVLGDAGVDRAGCVGVGAAGAVAAPDAARDLAQRLSAALPADEVAVGSDALTSHAGALAGGAGVVLAVGTGAVAVGVGTDGRFVLVDGAGPWLGDEGGGAWIGLAGLRAALHAHDGRGPDTALRPAAIDAFGALAALPATLDADGRPARTAASFAPVVARLAAGDAAAAAIMERAAAALAGSVRAAIRRLTDAGTPPGPLPWPLPGTLSATPAGNLPVALTGGLLRLGPALLEPLTALLGPSLRPAVGGSLDGARLLAGRRDTPHEPLLVRVVAAGVS